MAEYGSPELQTTTLEAAADLSACQWHIVRLSAARKCNIGSEAANSTGFGVLQNKPKLGDAATVGVFGHTKIVAGEALTAGVLFAVNGSGRAAAVASGGWVMGRILETAAADGSVVSAMLGLPYGRQGGAI
jgi:hypothetical protein